MLNIIKYHPIIIQHWISPCDLPSPSLPRRVLRIACPSASPAPLSSSATSKPDADAPSFAAVATPKRRSGCRRRSLRSKTVTCNDDAGSTAPGAT